MPLLMPYFMDYDMALLSIAAVVCAADTIRFGYDRSVLLAWVALYIAMEFNALIAGSTSVIPAVPFLALLFDPADLAGDRADGDCRRGSCAAGYWFICSRGMNSGISSSTGIIRRRLWQGGGLVGCFILSLIVTNFFLPSEKAATREMIGHDFLPFYAAGSFARTGQFQNLYDLTAIKLREQAVEQSAGLAVGFGPWWNPPFAAWVFAPFSYLPFSTALIVWEAVGLIALAISLLLLARMLPDSGTGEIGDCSCCWRGRVTRSSKSSPMGRTRLSHCYC